MLEELDDFIIVHMGETKSSTLEKSIIGTNSLATCFGVLLYSESNKVAIVSHSDSSNYNIKRDLLKAMVENDIIDNVIKYKIIDGYYPDDHYGVKKSLLEWFELPIFKEIEEELITENAIYVNESYESNEFLFDAKEGKFVTNNYLSFKHK